MFLNYCDVTVEQEENYHYHHMNCHKNPSDRGDQFCWISHCCKSIHLLFLYWPLIWLALSSPFLFFHYRLVHWFWNPRPILYCASFTYKHSSRNVRIQLHYCRHYSYLYCFGSLVVVLWHGYSKHCNCKEKEYWKCHTLSACLLFQHWFQMQHTPLFEEFKSHQCSLKFAVRVGITLQTFYMLWHTELLPIFIQF